MLVCAAPHPSLDKLFEVECLEPGAIHRPLAFVTRAGGKGFNVARVAHALGHPVQAVGPLAGHTGRLVAELLAEEGVAVRSVVANGETRSALSVHSRADGATTEFYEGGGAGLAAAWPTFADAVVTAARESGPGRWVTVSGSIPCGVDPGAVGALVGRLRNAGARVAVDQHGAALEAAVAGCDLVKVNEHEARGLTSRDARASLAVLAGRAGGAAVILTLGVEGALLREPDGAVARVVVGARGAYPTGSGDALLAGVVCHLGDEPEDWRGALATGSGAAAANAEQPGAGSLDPARARALTAACRVLDG